MMSELVAAHDDWQFKGGKLDMSNIVDNARPTKQLPAPLHLPAVESPIVTTKYPYPAYRPLDLWDRDYCLDVAVAAQDNGYPLSCEPTHVERMCAEMCSMDLDLTVAREQIAALKAEIAASRSRTAEIEQERGILALQLESALAETLRLSGLHAKISSENAELRRSSVNVAFERLTVKATGKDCAALTAELNEHIRSTRTIGPRTFDLSDADTEVIDIDALDGISLDRKPTQRIAPISMFEQVYGAAQKGER